MIASGVSACSSGPLATSPAARIGDRSVSRQAVVDQVELAKKLTDVRAKAQGLGEDDYQSLLSPFLGEGADTMPTSAASSALTTLVQIEILREAVERQGGEITDAMRAQAKTSVEQTLSGQGLTSDDVPKAWLDQQIEFTAVQAALRASIEVSEEDLQAAYDAQVDSYTQICVSVIVTTDEAGANAAFARLGAGEAFGDVAKDVSIDEVTATQGGEAGCAAVADVAASLGPAIGTVDVNTPMDPTEVQGGWLIAMVTSRDVPSLEDIAEQLKPELQSPKVGEVVQPIVESVEVDPRYGNWNVAAATVLPPGIGT